MPLRPLRIGVSMLGYALLAACLAVAAVPLYGVLTGDFRLLPVLSGSMEPGMERGDLAWVEPKPLADLQVGDVLVFNSPTRGSTPGRRTIHRVAEFVEPSIIRPDDVKPGAVYIRTKGDANEEVDPWIAAVTDPRVWVRTRVIPEVATPLVVFGRSGLLVAALLLAAVVIGAFGFQMLRQAVGDSERSSSGARTRPPPGPPEAFPGTGKPAGWVSAFSLRPLFERTDRTPVHPAPAPPATERFSDPGRQWRRSAALGSVAVVAVGLTALGAAVAAWFSDTETSRSGLQAGTVDLEVGDSTLTLTISDLLPGEQVERVAELRNTGSIALSWVQLEAMGSQDPVLDPTAGLQLGVDSCSEPWEISAGTRPVASCRGTSQVLVADRPLLGRSDLDPAALASRSPGGSDHLRFTMRLPQDAPAGLDGAEPGVTLTFRAAQRAPLNR
ncbi:MAG TPA: signal peptidase I [Actinomycetota bacterium]|nr:signal peptidase I [Actinomycetota bacterium]